MIIINGKVYSDTEVATAINLYEKMKEDESIPEAMVSEELTRPTMVASPCPDGYICAYVEPEEQYGGMFVDYIKKDDITAAHGCGIVTVEYPFKSVATDDPTEQGIRIFTFEDLSVDEATQRINVKMPKEENCPNE